MRPIEDLTFPQFYDEVLSLKLHLLTKEIPLVQVFFHLEKEDAPGHLIIVAGSKKEAEVIRSRKWIRNLYKTNHILTHILSKFNLEYNLKQGNPFVPFYCTESAMIYKSGCSDFPLASGWTGFRKKFKSYKEQFYHDHDLLLSEANRFHKLSSYISVYLTYLSIFEHDLRYLEQLYIGTHFSSLNLHERINQVKDYLYAIERLFVKKNEKEYYLIHQLEKAITASETEEFYVNYELYDSIKETESKLYGLVTSGFRELKKRIKSDRQPEKLTIHPEQAVHQNKEQAEVINLITKTHIPEEIYMFHKREKDNHEIVYYLLLIGNGMGNQLLERMEQSANSKMQGKCSVVLIAHTRIWIQENLFAYQEFFKNIMTVENKIFSVHYEYPQIHWENPYTPCYPDLDYYYRSAKKNANQFFVLKKHSKEGNHEGQINLFSSAVVRILRTYLFASTSYLPNHLSPHNLWQLCLYAEPKLKKYEYVLEKFSRDNFFKSVSYHLKFHHTLTILSEEELSVMDEILSLLLNELKNAVKNAKRIKLTTKT